MKYLKLIVLVFPFFLFSCTDEWQEEQDVKQLTKYNWELYMYVDGQENEVVSVGEMTYEFSEDGVFRKFIGLDDYQTSTWEITQPGYVRIGSATFLIKTLTNKILTLEYGEDVMYFLPVEPVATNLP